MTKLRSLAASAAAATVLIFGITACTAAAPTLIQPTPECTEVTGSPTPTLVAPPTLTSTVTAEVLADQIVAEHIPVDGGSRDFASGVTAFDASGMTCLQSLRTVLG